MKTLRPPALKPGDRIGVFSPSSPATHFAPKRTERAIAFLEEQGYEVKMGALSGKHDHWRSGSIRDRAAELNALIRDSEVRCIISSIGGSNSNSLLPHIDYEALRADPKIFCGYSDVTALHSAIGAKTGLITFYGPALTASLGEFEPIVTQTWQAFLDVVSEHARAPYTPTNPTHWTEEFLDWEAQDRAKVMRPNTLTTVSPGRHTGRLVGGNLNTLSGVWGTSFEPRIEQTQKLTKQVDRRETDRFTQRSEVKSSKLISEPENKQGDILLIEDSLKSAAAMERVFARLHNSGVLEKIGGLILGKHELFDDQGSGKTPLDILLEVIGGEPDFPMLAGYDCAHTHPMITLPLGARVTLDADAQQVTIEERCVT